MQVNSTKKWIIPPKELIFLVILLLVLGVFFRFVNLEKKVYTTDEVRGLLRISGYTSQYFSEQIFDGNIITVEDLQRYQHPNSERNLTDTIRSLADNPEHPPLYYLMARFWMQWFGNPVAARSLAVFISLLIFPCLYWLCLELFESLLTGCIAIALVAISPFHLMLAQEARQYSLWTVATLLSSASLLRALRLKTKSSWIIYAVTVAIGIYSHLFFTWVVIAQGIYVCVIERGRFNKTLVAYLLASFGGVLTFLPWIVVVITNLDRLDKTTNWVASYNTNLLNRLGYWLHNLTVIFLDINYDIDFKNPFYYLILILVIYSIYHICNRTSKQVWLFVLFLIIVTALAQVIPDLIWGGRRSLLGRYLVPCYLGIQIVVAYLFSTQISVISLSLWRRRLWQFILVALISAGVLSCALSSQAQDWWKGSSSINLQVAPVINQATQPLVISDASETFILPLSYLLDSKVRLQLFDEKTIIKAELKLNDSVMDRNFSDRFLYYPSPKMQPLMKTKLNYTLKPIVGESKWFKDTVWLYKMIKN